MSVGSFLKKVRQQRGYTIKAVVDKADGIIDKTTLSRIERDERGISLKAAYALSQIYNISMEHLSERILSRRLDTVDKIPFETSDDERTLIEAYRFLENRKQGIVFDIIWGLAEFDHESDFNISEKRLRDALGCI